MKTNVTIFSERLKQLRTEMNWNQDVVAKSLGISRASLINYESGIRIPDIELLYKIADVFQVSTDYLLGKSNLKINFEDIDEIASKYGMASGVLQLFWLKKMEEPENLETLNMLLDPWNDFHLSNILLTIRKITAVKASELVAKKRWLFAFMKENSLKIKQSDLSLSYEEIVEKYLTNISIAREWETHVAMLEKTNQNLETFNAGEYHKFMLSQELIKLADSLATCYINDKRLYIPEHLEYFIENYCNNPEDDDNEECETEKSHEQTEENQAQNELDKYGPFIDAIAGPIDMTDFVITKE